jgi:hypothetical protein
MKASGIEGRGPFRGEEHDDNTPLDQMSAPPSEWADSNE